MGLTVSSQGVRQLDPPWIWACAPDGTLSIVSDIGAMGRLGVGRQCRRRDAASGHASSPQQCHGKGAGSAQAQGRAMPPVEVRAEIVPWNAMPFVRASTHDRKVSRLPTRIPFPTLRTFHTTAARRISSRGLPYSPQTARKCNTKAGRVVPFAPIALRMEWVDSVAATFGSRVSPTCNPCAPEPAGAAHVFRPDKPAEPAEGAMSDEWPLGR